MLWSNERIDSTIENYYKTECAEGAVARSFMIEMRDEYESHRKAGMEILEEWERTARLAIVRYEKAEARIAELEAELDKHRELVDTLYGKNMMVHGWHQNGEPEPFDQFVDDMVFSE